MKGENYMSTRSYVGIIKDGMVKYGYHHCDSHLESLGIELFNIKTESELLTKIDVLAELDMGGCVSVNDYFRIPKEDIFMEFCYGFNVDDNEWYVSSCHFINQDKMYKLTELVKNDEEMEHYLDTYYERYRKEILSIIRNEIK